MINYTDILIEALEDNHIEFLGVYHSKNKLSLKKNMIEDLYIEWFLAKAQIIDRDFYIERNVFIDKCIERVILMMQVLKDDKSRHEEFIQFGFMFTALGGMKKVMESADSETETPEFLTTLLNQVRMKAIYQWLYENNYIDVDVDSWLYWFSLQSWINKKQKPAKIKWTKAAYHLPNVVYLICGNMNKFTEAAMKKSFTLQKSSKFQNLTTNNIKSNKEPYKSLYNMIGYKERIIKDL